jgi:predicted nucleotidyltransferase/HEPN domain-containing protein
MKDSLSHLPENNQKELRRITEIIREVANPEMVILFGSYAKGNFTEHSYLGRDGIRYEYVSDYDLLVVTKQAEEKAYELEDKITNRSRMYRSAVNMEIHDIDYINEGLEFGQYFFTEIVNEGIILYDKGSIQFAKAKNVTPEEKKQIALQDFERWFERGSAFLKLVDHVEPTRLNDAAFLLHQVTESFYYAVLLTFTGYKPKTHNLGKLRRQTKILSEELYFVFPAEINKTEHHLFDLLKRGYVDARYRNDYVISSDELETILTRVKEMQAIVQSLCKNKIKSIT